ncbi:MAG: hypothetical protein SOT81_11120 [Treponema sp.]|nr:hypothetical protein [Treponema sp.]
MKKEFRLAGFFAFILACFLLSSCGKSSLVHSLNENRLFSLKYGNFEDELNLFDLAGTGTVSTFMEMRDGFFYIANGESKKILELNSYGDLLSLSYNEEVTKDVKFAETASFDGNSRGADQRNSTKKAVSYPFNTLGPVTVDARKFIYAADTLPSERQEMDSQNKNILKNVVLRFDNNGNFIDYIGQQGPGGTPFPFIKKIYTTKKDELVVVCTTSDGSSIYWFNTSGFLIYNVLVSNSTVPKLSHDEKTEAPEYLSIENIVPDSENYRLYIKVDYYIASLDEALKVQSGVDYEKTMLYPLDVQSGKYEEPLEIPSYEYVITENMAKEVYNLPYNFMGVTENGWFFFIIPDENGFLVQMVQPDGQRIVKRSLSVDHSKILYYTLSLSGNGIISGLFVKKDAADVVWWRTDSLLSSLLNN